MRALRFFASNVPKPVIWTRSPLFNAREMIPPSVPKSASTAREASAFVIPVASARESTRSDLFICSLLLWKVGEPTALFQRSSLPKLLFRPPETSLEIKLFMHSGADALVR